MAYTIPIVGEPRDALSQLLGNTEELRQMFIGPVAPTVPTPVEGQMWLDTATDPHVVKVFIDTTGTSPTWQALATLIGADVDYTLFQALNFRIENTGADPVPSAPEIGRMVLHTGESVVKVVLSATALGTLLAAEKNVDMDSVRPTFGWFVDGTNPPTVAEAAMGSGAGGNFGGWEFDADNERIHASVRVPRSWSGTADPIVRVHCLVANAGQLTTDEIRPVLKWNKQTPVGSDVATRNSTQDISVAQALGAGNAQYAAQTVDLTIDHDVIAPDPNAISVGDMLNLEIGLRDVGAGAVTGIIVNDVEILFPMGNTVFEQ